MIPFPQASPPPPYSYDPGVHQDFHAGRFGPNGTDNTYGIQVTFQTAGPGVKGSRPHSDGHQYFGGVEMDTATRKLTVTQRAREGKVVDSVTLDPEN